MKASKNPAASVKARLLTLAHAQKADFQQLFMRYALERLLYRLEPAQADGLRFDVEKLATMEPFSGVRSLPEQKLIHCS